MVEQKAKKGAKKSFYEVEAPLTSAKIHLYGSSLESFDGKVVKIDLTRSLKGKSFELRLKIILRDGKLESKPISLQLAGSYIRKVFRNGIDYVEDSFDVECRDCKARIKPFLMTRRRVSRSVCNALRTDTRNYLSGYLKTRDSAEIFSEIMANKLQKQLFVILKKIYPLALCEIRMFSAETNKEGFDGSGNAQKEAGMLSDKTQESKPAESIPAVEKKSKKSKIADADA